MPLKLAPVGSQSAELSQPTLVRVHAIEIVQCNVTYDSSSLEMERNGTSTRSIKSDHSAAGIALDNDE